MKKLLSTLSLLTISLIFIGIGGQSRVQAEEAQAEPDIFFFWGDGCPHCELALEEIEEKNYTDILPIRFFETWYEEANAELFVAALEICGVPLENAGVPTLYINGKCAMGSVDTITLLESYIEEPWTKPQVESATAEAEETDLENTEPNEEDLVSAPGSDTVPKSSDDDDGMSSTTFLLVVVGALVLGVVVLGVITKLQKEEK